MKKITLKPGESVTEEIHLSPEAFMLYDEKGNFTLEKGAYDIFVGGCQPEMCIRDRYILIFFPGLGSYSSYNDIYDHIYDDIYDDIEDLSLIHI